MYLPMSLFHARTAGPISTKFCTDLPTNPGMVLSTSMTAPTWPPDPRVPQTPKLQKTRSSNFSRAAPGPGWLVNIYKTDCMYLCTSFTRKPLDQSPPNFAQIFPPTQWRFLTQVWPCQSNYLTLVGLWEIKYIAENWELVGYKKKERKFFEITTRRHRLRLRG